MGFFHAGARQSKAAPTRRGGVIPVASLQKMGCRGCPRDGSKLCTPKMRPDGDDGADVFVLMAAPTQADDRDGAMLRDAAGREVARALGRRVMARAAVGSVVQCAGDAAPEELEVECCRPRVVAEIERLRPSLVVAVGDLAVRWATGATSGTAVTFRGQPFVARIGSHACRVLPVLYPNYVHKRDGRGGGECQLALEHDARLAASLADMPPPDVPAAPYDAGIEVVTGQEPGDMQRLERALADLLERPAVDIETNGLRPYMLRRPHIYTAAASSRGRTVAFSLDHPDGWGSEAQRRRAHGLFAEYLVASGRKAAHNLAMELEWFGHFYGLQLLRRTEWDDTMASAHVLNGQPGTKSLDAQTLIHFGFSVKALSKLDSKRLLEYPIRQALRYNGLDAKWTDALRDAHRPLLKAEPQLLENYEFKLRTAPTLVLTEAKGLPVDFAYAGREAKKLEEELADIERRIAADPDVRDFRRRKGPLEPTNADHVLAFMQFMGRKEVEVYDRREDKTRHSTEKEVLEKIPAREVPVAPMILEHRETFRNLSTYVRPTLSRENVCPDGRIRSKYSQMRTSTDRLASDDPAVQNWPKRKHKHVRGMVGTHTEEELRREAEAARRRWFASFDYGQIEFRVCGMASEDRNLVKYCWTGYDVHKFWAERMVRAYGPIKDWVVETFKVDWDEKGLKTLRQEAKNGWVFPQLFGSSTRSCAERMHLPEDVADELGAEFWDEFQGVKRWQERLLRLYEKRLYVETLDGMRRRGPMTKNEIINQPIQGTAARVVIEAFNALSIEAELRDDPQLQPSLNVHDDLSTILDDEGLEGRMDVIIRTMCTPRFSFINVPLVVEASLGPRWSELEEVGVYRSDELFGQRNPYA